MDTEEIINVEELARKVRDNIRQRRKINLKKHFYSLWIACWQKSVTVKVLLTTRFVSFSFWFCDHPFCALCGLDRCQFGDAVRGGPRRSVGMSHA